MQLTIREPGSAITHFIACLMALMAASPLMIKAQGNTTNMLAMAVFAGSMILLYGASTAYHSISRVSDKVLRIFRKIDHMMIFVKACWITCPKWFSSVIYIAMGWTCLLVFGTLWDTLPHAAFGWLLAGGIIYTIGGIIYALKLPVFDAVHKYFGSHEIFHLFVMGGSICHFIFMYNYVV